MALDETARYGRLLVVLVVAIGLVIAVGDGSPVGSFISTSITVLVYLAAGRLVTIDQGWRRLWLLLVVVMIATSVIFSLQEETEAGRLEIPSIAAALLVLETMRLVSVRAIRDAEEITVRLVSAALSVYLLAGLFFAYVFQTIDLIADPAFTIPEGTTRNLSTWVYTSFVTQTTLGYGDVVPVVDVARSATILQAVAGQIYVITVIGFLVGNMRGRSPDTADDGPPDPDA